MKYMYLPAQADDMSFEGSRSSPMDPVDLPDCEALNTDLKHSEIFLNLYVLEYHAFPRICWYDLDNIKDLKLTNS